MGKVSPWVIAGGLTIASLSAPALRTQVPGASFKDHLGNVSISGLGSFKFERASGHFVATGLNGGLIHAVSKRERLTVQAPHFDGLLKGSAQGGFVLDSATLTGGVKAVAQRSSAGGGLQTSTVEGAQATYEAAAEKMHVTGGVTVDSIDPSAHQKIHVTGSTADLVFSQPSSQSRGLRAATMEGGVKMTMEGDRLEQSQGVKAARVPFKIVGTGDRLVFDDAEHTLVLSGHVHTSGDDPSMGGDVDADRVTFNLNADGSVNSVELSGSPGRTVYREKGRGGKPL